MGDQLGSSSSLLFNKQKNSFSLTLSILFLYPELTMQLIITIAVRSHGRLADFHVFT